MGFQVKPDLEPEPLELDITTSPLVPLPTVATIWKSEYGGFKNSSQNYSQLALASLLVLDNLIHSTCDEIKDCKEN